MSGRTKMLITLELLSDTIFGSGYGVPGGEDIAGCLDREGCPCLRGTALKGLLRESLQNWLAWTGGEAGDADVILGRSGRTGAENGRRAYLTDLTLAPRPEDPEDCFVTRAFTSVENGVAQDETLRAARCARAGLRFAGSLECAPEDAAVLECALRAIKWAGGMRSRGLGRVRLTVEKRRLAGERQTLPPANCIRYRLRTELPVLMTVLDRSQNNGYETAERITGAAVRGAVMGALAAREPDWFAAHRTALLSERTRFLDALALPPSGEALVPLPAVCGFYERRDETGLEHLFFHRDAVSDRKRAGLGVCCALRAGVLWHWSPETGGAARIRRTDDSGDAQIFETRWLEPEQEFEGYILLEDPTLAPALAAALGDTVWLGADRHAGFGKCAVTELAAAAEPAWIRTYGCRTREETGVPLSMLALSPLCMADRFGTPCGLDEVTLAARLGVGSVQVEQCCAALSACGGYNRTWGCRAPEVQMYDSGSLFRIRCDRPPDLEALERVQREGLGLRTAEGFGQVLFLRPGLLEGIREKRAVRPEKSRINGAAARARRARCAWIEARSCELSEGGLSASQLGEIQRQCQRAAAGDAAGLNALLDKNLHGRGPRQADRYESIDRLIRRTLEEPLPPELGICDFRGRMELLDRLFDYSRKR